MPILMEYLLVLEESPPATTRSCSLACSMCSEGLMAARVNLNSCKHLGEEESETKIEEIERSE